MYDLYTVTLFSPNSLSHQNIDFHSLADAVETTERLRFFFLIEGLKIKVKLYHHDMDEELINPIDSREIYTIED